MTPLRALRRLLRCERGQTLPLVVISAAVLIGFCGFAIDMGRVWVAKQELQRAIDAATLAAGQDLPDSSTAYSQAVAYAGTGTRNPVTGWGVTANAPTVTFECDSSGPDYTSGSTPTCLTDSSGNGCHPSGSNAVLPSGATTCNAVRVTETATVKTSLLSLFIPSFTVSATSTATARQAGVPNPMDVYVILDTTGSMTQSCSATVSGISNPSKLDCAKDGVRTLLGSLDPCSTSLTTCGAATNGNVSSPLDEVGVLVFPALSMTMASSSPYTLSGPPSASLTDETNCGSNSFSVTYPPWQTYTYNASATDGGIPLSGPSTYHDANGDNYLGYEAVGLSSDYRTSDSATSLNLSSNLVDSVDWGETGCTSFPGSDKYGVKDIGGQGSYLAGAISEAQYLLATDTRTVNGSPVAKGIIVLSDGELNDPNSGSDGVDPGSSANQGWTDTTPCEDALNAATAAKAAGTLIFSIAYDDSGGQCDDSGSGGYSGSAQTLMQDLATSSAYYFSQSSAGSLTSAFTAASSALTGNSQLMPDCTTPPNC